VFGEQYFIDRLAGLYELSPVKYLSGTGELHFNNIISSVQWELVVPITGEHTLFLHHKGYSDLGLFIDPKILGNPGFSLSGSSSYGEWDVSIPTIQIFDVSTSINSEMLISMNCYAREILLRKCGTIHNEIDHIKGLIRNFDFLGSEVTQDGSRSSLDKIRVIIRNKEISFRTIKDSNMVKALLKSKRIDRALLSTVTLPLDQGENIEEIYSLLKTICWLLSLINVNACLCPIVQQWSGQELIAINIRNLISSQFHRNIIIDNKNVRNGIVDIFNNCYEEYCNIDSAINLSIFVSNLLGMYEGKFLEHKIVGLLLSYEYILTKYLIYLGHDENEVAKLSIQDKLRRLNIILRFIPSRLLGDILRENVRNPLFHSGELTLLNTDEKTNVFKEYFDLLIQIVLKLIGYTGGYISPIDYEVRHILGTVR